MPSRAYIRLDTLERVTPPRLFWGANSGSAKVKRSALFRTEGAGRVPFMAISALWAVRVVPDLPLDRRVARVAYLMLRDGCTCLYCNAFLDPATCTVEHVVPTSAGGPDHASNLALTCAGCNALVGHLSAAEKVRRALDRLRSSVVPAPAVTLNDAMARFFSAVGVSAPAGGRR